MEHKGRYAVPTNEDVEPGSNGEVLKNFHKITSKEIIEALEEEELARAESELINIYGQDHRFTAEDVFEIHELWLGDIYPSAGKYRSVVMSKAGFTFAAPTMIPSLMNNLEQKILAKYTPCRYTNLDELAFALGVVHVELIIIHPFREGNGRTARLLADLMAIQSGHPPLNFGYIDQTVHKKGFEEYILAIHAGHGMDYEPMKRIFKILLEESV
jgi:cell filamentation protein